MLERAGYRVLLARDGEEALTTYRNNQVWISAVLLDFGLPKINGKEVYLKLTELNPNIKVLVVSGYLNPETFAGTPSSAAVDFLQKPFMSDELVDKLDRLLHRPPTNLELPPPTRED